MNKYLYAALVAVAIAGFTGYRMFRNGMAGFDSFTLFMSLAAVVAVLIVAPGKFTPGGDRPQWEGRRSFGPEKEPEDESKGRTE